MYNVVIFLIIERSYQFCEYLKENMKIYKIKSKSYLKFTVIILNPFYMPKMTSMAPDKKIWKL